MDIRRPALNFDIFAVHGMRRLRKPPCSVAFGRDYRVVAGISRRVQRSYVTASCRSRRRCRRCRRRIARCGALGRCSRRVEACQRELGGGGKAFGHLQEAPPN